MKKTWLKYAGVAVCAVCVVVSTVLATAGLGGSGPQAGPSGPADPNQVVATVNGTPIVEAQVAARLRQQLAQMARTSGMAPEMQAQLSVQFRPRAVDSLITEQLLVEQVRDANMAPTEAELAERIKTIAGKQEPTMTVEQFQAMLKQRGYDYGQVQQQVGRDMGIRKLLQVQCGDKVTVTDVDANSYYVGHPQEFDSPAQVKVSHILIKPEEGGSGVDPNHAKAEARKKAEALLAEVQAGKDFAELAKANSACPSSQKGGDLGFIDQGTSFVSPFKEVALGLHAGQVSDVVQTQFGFHIIKATEQKEARHVPFEEVKAGLIEKLTRERVQELTTQYIDSLKAKAAIAYPVAAR